MSLINRYDGFLRASIADPAPDRRWFRRGWVTFRRDVKIKDICFNLNNIRLAELVRLHSVLPRKVGSVTSLLVHGFDYLFRCSKLSVSLWCTLHSVVSMESLCAMDRLAQVR